MRRIRIRALLIIFVLIEVILSVDGYGDVETGINAIKGTLEIDSDVFEKPGQEDFELLDYWENIRYNPENEQFVLSRRAGSPEGGDVLRIRLTAGETDSEADGPLPVTEEENEEQERREEGNFGGE